MEEAAAIVGGMDRLAISPQCGFASVMVGNDIDEDVQWRKLELVGTGRRADLGLDGAGRQAARDLHLSASPHRVGR